MTTDVLPTLIALVIAIVGAGGGMAALMRVGSDRDKTQAEAASTVLTMLRQQVLDMDKRLDELECHIDALNEWADRVLTLVENLLSNGHGDIKAQARDLAKSRPRRNP